VEIWRSYSNIFSEEEKTMLKRFFVRTHLFILFGLTAFLALGGCATIFSDGEDEITFNSNVDKTKVFFDNSLVGETPFTLSVDRQLHRIKVRFSKEGYQDQEMLLAHKFNMNAGMVLDLTGTLTFLTPGAVDALSGNLIKYSPTNYHIEMVPEKVGDLKRFRQRVASMQFSAHNFADIQRDLVTGEGEFLNTLQSSFQIPQTHKKVFNEVLTKNLDVLINTGNGLEFWNRLNKLVKEDPTLTSYYFS
jgi:hypothetical protein